MTCLTPEAIHAYAKISMKERQAAAIPMSRFSRIQRPKLSLDLRGFLTRVRQAPLVLLAERAYDTR